MRGSLLNFDTAALPIAPVRNRIVAAIDEMNSVGNKSNTARPVQKAEKARATVSAIDAQTSSDTVRIVMVKPRKTSIGGPERRSCATRNACFH